jgi:hypothetical protein
MKHLIARTLTALVLTVVGLSLAAQAQSTQFVKANIPFEFNFGDKVFPAGEYSLTQPLQHLLVLRDSRGQAIAQTFTEGVDSTTAPDATKLRFHHSDGQYVLTEVWKEAEANGQRLQPAKSRTNVAKQRSTEARETAEGSRP